MYKEPSDALLIVIRTALESVLFQVKASHIRNVLDELGYKNFRCGYLRERYWRLKWKIINRKGESGCSRHSG